MVPAQVTTALQGILTELVGVAQYWESRLAADLKGLSVVTIEPRVKEIASVYQKLQTGKYQALHEIRDLVGLQVVLIRRSDVDTAVSVVADSHTVVYANTDEPVEPQSMRYNQPHLVVELPADFAERNPSLAAFPAEIQFTSALQHALDIVTHDFDYKGRSFRWQNFRIVAELRGMLELADNILDDIYRSAELDRFPRRSPEAHERRQMVISVLLDCWGEDRAPRDMRRASEVIDGLVLAAEVGREELEARIRAHPDLLGALSLDPVDAVLGVLLREKGAEFLANYDGRVCVSDELLSLCEEARLVPDARKVRFSLE